MTPDQRERRPPRGSGIALALLVTAAVALCTWTSVTISKRWREPEEPHPAETEYLRRQRFEPKQLFDMPADSARPAAAKPWWELGSPNEIHRFLTQDGDTLIVEEAPENHVGRIDFRKKEVRGE